MKEEYTMKMINLTIDGIPVSVPEGSTVLEAAKEANINIPTLAILKMFSKSAPAVFALWK